MSERMQISADVIWWVIVVTLAVYLAGAVVTWVAAFVVTRRYRLECPEQFARQAAEVMRPWVRRRTLLTQNVLLSLVAGVDWPTFFWYLRTERKGKRP